MLHKSIRKQNPHWHGGQVVRATKGPVQKTILGIKVIIPRGGTLTIYKDSRGLPSKAILRDTVGRVLKKFFIGSKHTNPRFLSNEGPSFE